MTPPEPGEARIMSPRWAAGLIALLGLALYLPGLGSEILRSPLEVKYALVARQMLDGAPLLVPRIFGELYPDKPPLYFWTTAALGWLAGGIDETTARLPAALAAVGALLMVHRLGTDLFGPRAGLMAACALATSNLFFWYARQGHPDQFLIAFVTLACLGLWRSLHAGTHRAGWTTLAYGAMGIGVLSKGLLGALLPLLAATTYLLLTGSVRAMPARLHLRLGLPVFFAVVLAWYGPAVAHTGRDYLYETLIHQHLSRYVRAWEHQEPWYYYLGQFPVQFLPWALFLPGALVLGWRSRRAASGRSGPGSSRPPADPGIPGTQPVIFPLAWFASGFLLFSLSGSKRGAYLLPLYPAAALLVGWLWARSLATRDRSRWLGLPLTALGAAAALLALVLAIVPRRVIVARIGPASRADTLVPAEPWQLVGIVALLLAGAAGLLWAWRRDRPGAAFATLVAAQAVVLLGVTTVRAPQYEARLPIRTLAARVRQAVPPGRPVIITLRGHNLLAAFYVDRPVALRAGTEPVLAARRSAAEPGYALVDGDAAILGQPGIHTLAEAWLGREHVVFVRVDPAP